MKVKTSELTGHALNWAVATCEGSHFGGNVFNTERFIRNMPKPSTDWAQGGPIIEREGIRIVKVAPTAWGAVYSSGDVGREHFAETPLIAAMRCYCSAMLGDEVEIPEKLQ